MGYVLDEDDELEILREDLKRAEAAYELALLGMRGTSSEPEQEAALRRKRKRRDALRAELQEAEAA